MARIGEDDWHVYMVRCADGTLYTGIAKNLKARMELHNAGRGAKYTRSRLPVRLAYSERLDSRGAALRREVAIKGLSRSEKRALAGGQQKMQEA